jgi:hypothetical protein
MLVWDLQAPRKQRHTAHRIWMRLRDEHPKHPIGEATVRRYEQEPKRELGLRGREVFGPQRRKRSSRVLTPELQQRVLDTTLKTRPAGFTHWSARVLAAKLGVSRIWCSVSCNATMFSRTAWSNSKISNLK